MIQKYCGYCGVALVSEQMRFCVDCGKPVVGFTQVKSEEVNLGIQDNAEISDFDFEPGYYALNTDVHLVRRWNGTTWDGRAVRNVDPDFEVLAIVNSLTDSKFALAEVTHSSTRDFVANPKIRASYFFLFSSLGLLLLVLFQLGNHDGSSVSNISDENVGNGSSSGHYIERCQNMYRRNPAPLTATSVNEMLNSGGQWVRECRNVWIRD